MVKETPVEKLDYEKALEELDAIVSALEGDEQTLEAALALFERGQELAKLCAKLLDEAELKVQQLTAEDTLTEME
ncbi:MAG: exodeoxyribonuclease VII small subunit [Chloroflexi bacterium]|nr:exodeoxyribonuclease VII small subunit [Chloroflexota bacterium]